MLSGRFILSLPRRKAVGLASLLTMGAVTPGLAQTRPAAGVAPIVVARPVTDRIANMPVVDNYRWMEAQPPTAEFNAYLRAATALTQSTLERIPGRQRMIEAVSALDARGTAISALTPEYDMLYYLRRGANDDVARLVMRRAAGGPERVMIDPEALSDARPHSQIDQFAPSPNGTYIAYGLEDNGPNSSVLRIYDAVRNTTLAERIAGARFAQVTWDRESDAFYYTRAIVAAAAKPAGARTPGSREGGLQPADAQPVNGQPPEDKLGEAKTAEAKPGEAKSGAAAESQAQADAHLWGHLGVFMHRIGTDPITDVQVLDGAKLPFAFTGGGAIPRLFIPAESDFALALVSDGITPNLTIATVPVSQLVQRPAPWQLMASQADSVTQISISENVAFLLTGAEAPRLRVVTESLDDPGFEKARTVVPQTDGVITSIAAARDALYVARRQDAWMHLLRLDYGESVPEEIRLPYAGTIAPVFGVGTAREWGGLVADSRMTGAYFSVESWAHPLTWMRFDVPLRRAVDMGLLPDPNVDAALYKTVETSVRAEDGAEIPLSIVSRADVAMDHARPTLIDAYGSFGYSFDPRFMPMALAWADQGGVFAVAHVRGGGELGAGWHEPGTMARKINAARDLVACARALIKMGYTDPAHLAGMGTNAGTLAIGNAITLQPGLFRAALMNAGLNNPLRVEDIAGHDVDVLELGSVHIPLQQASVLSIDPYAQVKDGLEYPAVLLTSAANDAYEPVWQTAKMAARLAAASTSGHPVLMRIAFDRAREGPTRPQRDQEQADDLSFLLWQLGAAGFQPGEHHAAPGRKGRHGR